MVVEGAQVVVGDVNAGDEVGYWGTRCCAGATTGAG